MRAGEPLRVRRPPDVPMLNTAPLLPWLLAGALLLLILLLRWQRRRPSRPSSTLPPEWPIGARPVFSKAERRLYRLLRDALPHHIVLAKLSLVRFCQPHDPRTVRDWYQLLGPVHVSFAICSPNGRVLAAVDLEEAHQSVRLARQLRIKKSVFEACRIRYLRCPPDHLPSVPELQLLVPQSTQPRGPQPAPALREARDTLANTVAWRRAQRAVLWQDSSFFHDSFLRGERREEGWSSGYSSWPADPEAAGRRTATRPSADGPIPPSDADRDGDAGPDLQPEPTGSR